LVAASGRAGFVVLSLTGLAALLALLLILLALLIGRLLVVVLCLVALLVLVLVVAHWNSPGVVKRGHLQPPLIERNKPAQDAHYATLK
jgi:hypothetical protein